MPQLSYTNQSRLLFIGNSITDTGRRECSEGIGNGYVRMIRDYLLAMNPSRAPLILNRGIGGNRVTHLQARWQTDVLDEKPDVLTIKIGINDVWHGLAGKTEGVPVDEYARIYRELLLQTKKALPNCQLILMEPSVIWAPAPAEGNELLLPYIEQVHQLAEEWGALATVPTHSLFEEAKRARPDLPWAPDGVHPSSMGHMLIARGWLVATGLL